VPTQKVSDAKRREPGNRRITSYQPPNSRDIEVIVVIVGQYDSVDGRQRIEVNCCWYTSPGTGETKRRSTVAPDRIEQKVQTADLEQKRGVANPGDGEHRGLAAREYESRNGSGKSERLGPPTRRNPSPLEERPL